MKLRLPGKGPAVPSPAPPVPRPVQRAKNHVSTKHADKQPGVMEIAFDQALKEANSVFGKDWAVHSHNFDSEGKSTGGGTLRIVIGRIHEVTLEEAPTVDHCYAALTALLQGKSDEAAPAKPKLKLPKR